MNVEIKWYDNRKTAVIMSMLTALTTWAEFNNAVDQSLALAASVPHEVIVIVDPRGTPMPKQGAPLPNLRRAMAGKPANVKFYVGVVGGLGLFEKSIVDIAASITFRSHLKLVNSLEEAYKLIP